MGIEEAHSKLREARLTLEGTPVNLLDEAAKKLDPEAALALFIEGLSMLNSIKEDITSHAAGALAVKTNAEKAGTQIQAALGEMSEPPEVIAEASERTKQLAIKGDLAIGSIEVLEGLLDTALGHLTAFGKAMKLYRTQHGVVGEWAEFTQTQRTGAISAIDQYLP